jgi:hypothetical protein
MQPTSSNEPTDHGIGGLGLGPTVNQQAQQHGSERVCQRGGGCTARTRVLYSFIFEVDDIHELVNQWQMMDVKIGAQGG